MSNPDTSETLVVVVLVPLAAAAIFVSVGCDFVRRMNDAEDRGTARWYYALAWRQFVMAAMALVIGVLAVVAIVGGRKP